jgi:hypothetical protein
MNRALIVEMNQHWSVITDQKTVTYYYEERSWLTTYSFEPQSVFTSWWNQSSFPIPHIWLEISLLYQSNLATSSPSVSLIDGLLFWASISIKLPTFTVSSSSANLIRRSLLLNLVSTEFVSLRSQSISISQAPTLATSLRSQSISISQAPTLATSLRSQSISISQIIEPLQNYFAVRAITPHTIFPAAY